MISRIALAQISASDDIESNIQKGESFVKEAAAKNADYICFPELCFTKFFPQYEKDDQYFNLAKTIPGTLTNRFCQLAKDNNISIILNIFEKDEEGRFFDSSPIINSDGTLLGKAHMNHVAQEPLFNEKDYYHPGMTGFPVFETTKGKIGLSICYDRHYPEQIRALVLKGAEIIFIPQAGIEGNPIIGYELEMQGAAFSNQVYIVLVNRVGVEDQMTFTGGSFVVNPNGEIISHANTSNEELLICDCDLSLINKLRTDRPFLRDRRPELYGILQNSDNYGK